MLPNNIKYRLTPGFTIVLVLMVILSFVGLNSMAAIQHRLKVIVDNHNVKTALVTDMRNAARERTICLYRTITLTDPFERDEEFLKFNHFGAQFAKARMALLSMNLNEQERKTIKKQGELTGAAVELQEQTIDMALNDRIDEASRLLFKRTIPAQDEVFVQLTELLDIQNKAARIAEAEASAAYNHARSMMFILGVAALSLGGLIAVIVIRRTTQAETKLHREKERAQVTLHSIGEGVITTNANGKIEYLNPVAGELTGWSNSDAYGRSLLEVFKIIEDNGGPPLKSPVTRAIDENRIINSEQYTVLLRRDGAEYAIEHTAAPIKDYDESIIGAVLVFRNITDIHNMSKQLAYQASHDALTELINRHEFEERLKTSLTSARNENRNHVLCYLDLDQFKVVNDTCGHIAGDELLKQLAALLHNQLRKTDTLARLGGDEFALLLVDCPLDQALKIAETLRTAINDFRFFWQDKSFEVSASFGLVAITAESGSITDILSAADSACYVAKDLGRNRIHMYQRDDSALAKRHGEMQWLQRIREALEENLFCLHYQRIIPLSPHKNTVSTYEILVRMLGNQDLLIPPMAFLPAAERYALMPAVDRWVIKAACNHLKENVPNESSNKSMWTINLSGQTLCDDTFLNFVIEQFEMTKIDPQRICFEITETAAIANLSRATQLISVLKGMGCYFALDDFGSGLSSFSYLKNLPVDFVKIDGSFVKDMIDDPMDLAMVESINQIGHIMGLQTIAEFVENDATLEKLRLLNVDYAQGYGIHKPEPLVNLNVNSKSKTAITN